MRFASPEWLIAGAVACAALLTLMVWSGRRRVRSLARFLAPRHTSALTRSLSPARRRIKQLLLLLGTASAFAALARPQWGYSEVKQHTHGVDLLFAIDTSKSMLAEDVRPSRLARAKLAVEDLVSKVEGDRLGLIAFAGDAFLQTPLTHDRTAFAQSLSALEAGVIPVAGTDIASAIRVADRAFATEGDHQKVLVLLTDGENLSGAALEAARDAAARDLTVYAIGIGTKAGSLVPMAGRSGATEYLRGPDGELVRSELDEPALRAIASATSGRYYELGPSGRGLFQLYEEVLQKLDKSALSSTTKRVYHERFQWPLGLALALLLLEWVLGEQRRAKARSGSSRLQAAAAALAFGYLALGASAHANEASPLEAYNQAAESYRSGKFEEARTAYRRALETPDLTLQERAYYDLGNSLYRLGAAAGDKERSHTMARYREAIEAYDAALALNGKDEDARFNRDFVERKLEELEREQPEPSQESADSKQDAKGGDPQQQGANNDAKGGDPQQQGANNDAKGGDPQQQGASQSSKGDGSQDGARADQDPKGAASQSSQGQSGDPSQEQKGSGKPDDAQGRGDANAKADARSGRGWKGEVEQGQEAKSEPGNDARADGADGPAGTARAYGGDADGQPQPAEPASAAADPSARGAEVAAGSLTKEQAEHLLDSLAGELRQLPSGFGAMRERSRKQNELRKDW